MQYGIDVSDNQGLIEWKTVKKAGVQFAVLRSTRGSGDPDHYLQTNIRGCRENGIPTGFYKYSYAMNMTEARTEVGRVIKVLTNFGITPNPKTRIWLDMEYNKQLALGAKKCMHIITAYREEITKANFSFGLYMGMYDYDNRIDASSLSDYVWIARYPSTATKGLKDVPRESYKPAAKGGSKLFAWQFSSNGKVDGIRGHVDLDVAYFDFETPDVSQPASIGSVQTSPNTPSQALPKAEYYPKPSFTLLESLNNIGVDSSFANRKKIAARNGISNYTGTREENLRLLELLNNGKLMK